VCSAIYLRARPHALVRWSFFLACIPPARMHAIEIPLLICWRHAGLISKCAGALPALAKKMMVLSLTIGIRGTR
jgi:hypothetical protein